MFYNALARKGKLQDTAESDIESVVALHNNMNEKTWRKILQWEATTTCTNINDNSNNANNKNSNNVKLLKFQGRPTDLSPKAAFKHYVLGHPLPYDRHDWTIERSDGTTVRYVIDYYHDESVAREDSDSALPNLHDDAASRSLLVDVRPAADGIVEIWSRLITMPYARRVSQTSSFEPLPMRPSPSMISQVQESVAVWNNIQRQVQQQKNSSADSDDTLVSEISETEARQLEQNFATVLRQCRAAQETVDKCQNDVDCARASIDLTLCMGKIVCPLQHNALLQQLNNNNNDDDDDDDAIEEALSRVNECVSLKTQQHTIAKKQYPKLFE